MSETARSLKENIIAMLIGIVTTAPFIYGGYVHVTELRPICDRFKIGDTAYFTVPKLKAIEVSGTRIISKKNLYEIGVFMSTCTIRHDGKKITSVYPKFWCCS